MGGSGPNEQKGYLLSAVVFPPSDVEIRVSGLLAGVCGIGAVYGSVHKVGMVFTPYSEVQVLQISGKAEPIGIGITSKRLLANLGSVVRNVGSDT